MVFYRVFADAQAEPLWFTSEQEARNKAGELRGTAEALRFAKSIDEAILFEILQLGDKFPDHAPTSLLSREVICEFPKPEFLLPMAPQRQRVTRSIDDALSPSLQAEPENIEAAEAHQRQRFVWQALEYVGIAAAVIVMVGLFWFWTDSTVEDHYQRAAELRESGDLNNAGSELRKLLANEPYEFKARWRLGELYFQLGQFEPARDELERAIKHGYPGSMADPLLLETLFAQREYAEIIKRSLDIGPTPSAMQLVLVAQSYAHVGQVGLAVENLERATAIDPQYVPALREKARLSLSQGKLDESLLSAEQALKLAPTDVEALLVRGEIQLVRGDSGAAFKSLRAARQQARDDPRVHLGLARTELVLNNATEAAETLNRIAVKSHEGNYLEAVVDHIEGNVASANGLVHKALLGDPNNPAYLFLLGTLQYEEGLRADAESTLTRVLSLKPGLDEARLLLAVIQLDRGRPKSALQVLEPLLAPTKITPEVRSLAAHVHALAGNADASEGYFSATYAESARQPAITFRDITTGKSAVVVHEVIRNIPLSGSAIGEDATLAAMHIANGRLREAKEHARAYSRLHPSNPLGHYLLGKIEQRSGSLVDAKEHYDKALALDSDYISPMLSQGRMALANKQFRVAQDHYGDAIRRAPDDPRALLGMGVVLFEEDRPRAIDYLQRVRTLAPKDVTSRLMLAQNYLQQGDERSATQFAREATRISPGHIGATELLGRAHLGLDEAELAVESFARLAELQPDNATPHYYLGVAQRMASHDGEARASLGRAIALNPGYVEAIKALGELELEVGELSRTKQLANRLRALDAEVAAEMLLGDVALREAQPKVALAHFRRAMSLAPSSDLIVRVHQAEQNLTRTDASFLTLQNWLDSHPGDLMVRTALATGFVAASRPHDAIVEFEELLRIAPNNTVALSNLARLYGPDDVRSLSLARKAVEISPDEAAVVNAYGWLLAHLDDVQALSMLSKAAKLNPDDATFAAHLKAAEQTQKGEYASFSEALKASQTQ